MDPTRLIRQNILTLEPYSTARDDFQGDNVSAWLDANESPWQNGVNRYPDPHQRELKKRVSDIFGPSADSVFMGGAGSDEAIDLTFRIFCNPGVDNAIAITPSYGVYKVAAQINDVVLREVILNPDFSLPVERLLAETDDNTKLIWICSPNNPTGNSFPPEQILEICHKFNGMVVVDEAYADFSSQPSLLSHIGRQPNLIVLRTFSKAWGMAGMRCGMAFADPRIITYYDRVKYPYNMSGVIQKMLLERTASPLPPHLDLMLSEITRMKEELEKCPQIIKVFPTDANFILVKTVDADKLYDHLLGGGVIVRNRSRMPLCEGCLRITVGTPEENSLTLSLIKNFRQ